jgi:hypothetical protein
MVYVPQLQTMGEVRELKVYYPSGETQVFEAVFRGPVFVESGEAFLVLSVPQSQESRAFTNCFNEIIGLDPLCVVVDTRGGAVLYEPRTTEHFDKLAPSVHRYLEENPAWPFMLEMSEPRGRDEMRFLLGETPK